MYVILQMSRYSSQGKEPIIDVPSSPISKRTRCSSQASNSERFRTPLDSQTYSSVFEDAPTVVERVVKFDTLGTVRLNLINHFLALFLANLLVIQHLETLYLGGNHVKVVCKIV